MRKVIAAVLFGIAGACSLLAVFPVTALFDDYKDSPDAFYIGWAAIALAAAVVAAGAGAFLLRKLH